MHIQEEHSTPTAKPEVNGINNNNNNKSEVNGINNYSNNKSDVNGINNTNNNYTNNCNGLTNGFASKENGVESLTGKG